jgi:hypothetical protein
MNHATLNHGSKLVHLWRVAAIALWCASTPALGADVLIRGAEVHTLTSSGKLTGADVLIANAKIVAVGQSLTAPAGATVIEAKGRALTPGLFAGITAIGIEEVSAEESTVDESLKLGAPMYQTQWRPEFDVTLAYNPRSVLLPVARMEGLTWAVLSPNGGDALLAGQGAAITLDGSYDAVLPGSRSLFVSLGSTALSMSAGSRAGQYMLLDQAVRETRTPPPPGTPTLLLPAGREVLAGYLKGGRVVFDVHRAADIRQVLALAKRYGVKPVIAGGEEAWLVAEDLAKAKVPVLLNPFDNLPQDFDRIGARLDNAALLAQAGVAISFMQSNDPSHNARKIRQGAGNAVAHGLAWDAALAALTAVPADIFGLERRGRIAPGFAADLVLWSGDPLEVTTTAEQVWIAGAPVAMRSRQTELRDRYMEKLRRKAAR